MRDPQLHAGAPALASVPFGRPPVLLRRGAPFETHRRQRHGRRHREPGGQRLNRSIETLTEDAPEQRRKATIRSTP